MKSLFGTDGIRGTLGTDFLVHENIYLLGKALGTWACAQKKNPHILIIHDTRASCSYIKSTISSGLLQHSVTIHDGNVLPTPATFFLLKKYSHIDCALIISASHNPAHDNGIKIITRSGKPSEKTEQEITAYFLKEKEQLTPTNYKDLGSYQTLSTAQHDYSSALIKSVSKKYRKQFESLTVVLDCANGATSTLAPEIFRTLGTRVIAYNTKPDGKNINHECGSTHPEKLQQAVITCNAHIGFAFDGDGDRVIAVSQNGYIKNGDDLLALLLSHPKYKKTNTVIGTIMTNCGLEKFLEKKDKKLIRTAVGDKHIVRELKEQNLNIGGEASGHIIMHDVCSTGDGILVALKVLEAIIATENWNMVTFDHFPQVHMKVPVQEKKDLHQEPIKHIISQAEKEIIPGRLVVRYSGTENILRIMTESPNQNHGTTVAQNLAHDLSRMLI